MKQILILDPDNIRDESGFEQRLAARAIVEDGEGKIALLHVANHGYYKLPGGGIDEGEAIVDALHRECLEEIGCAIGDITELGIIDEYRKEKHFHQTSYCYAAKVAGEKGKPQFTESELERGCEAVWVDKAQTLGLLSQEASGHQGSFLNFIKMRDMAFVEEYLKESYQKI